MRTEAPGDQAQSSFLLRFIFGKNPLWTIVRILFVVLVVLVLFKFILLPIRVTGDSMLPTFRDGQIKFVNKLAYKNKDPQRGDIVAVEYLGRQILLLKRIVAVPGETFQVNEGEVYINGDLLEEPYAKGKIPPSAGKGLGHTDPVPLGPDEYMILGDNRDLSEGYFYRRKHIIGKVL
ncbi:MAG TPA: signal peptidase I [Verrucomicrobiae bacterium]